MDTPNIPIGTAVSPLPEQKPAITRSKVPPGIILPDSAAAHGARTQHKAQEDTCPTLLLSPQSPRSPIASSPEMQTAGPSIRAVQQQPDNTQPHEYEGTTATPSTKPGTPSSTYSPSTISSNETEGTNYSQSPEKQQLQQRKPRSKRLDLIPPLTRVHFACYQDHRCFAMSRNAIYPVPCMTCLKADQEMRWRCTFCCLRICGECLQEIRKCKRRSLRELLDVLVRTLEGS